jgi:membrane-bound serine protease (ClpP class)
MNRGDVNTLQIFLTDPNVVYLVLLFGLWVAVTAAYIPGTGVVEALAVITIIIALVIMNDLPTNWWAVLILVVGVLSFLLVPFLNNRLATIAQGGLIFQAIGGALLFYDRPVSWLLIGLTIAIALLYHNYALLPILAKSRQQKAVIDDNGQLVGALGRAVTPFNTVGVLHMGSVLVRGEHWSASSELPVQVGDEIMVLEREGLQLYVEAVKHKHAPAKEEEML